MDVRAAADAELLRAFAHHLREQAMNLLRCAALFVGLTPSLCVSAELTKDSLTTIKRNVAEDKAVLVDVREKSEWDKGHVKGAVFLPLSGLQGNAAALAKQLPKDKIIYTHCVVGKRSVTAGNV